MQAIAEFWEAEREGPDEKLTISHRVMAVDGTTAVVRVEVEYGEPGAGGDRWRDLWVLSFDAEGSLTRASQHHETTPASLPGTGADRVRRADLAVLVAVRSGAGVPC